MMLEFCVLGSGSSGNATIVRDKETTLLFDAGFSGKEIINRMKKAGLDPKEITAVIVSHEHGDHVKGVGVMSRRYGLPVYATPITHDNHFLRGQRLENEERISPTKAFKIDDFKITPFEVPHDASQTVGFRIENGGKCMAIATDMGHAPAKVQNKLKNCDALVLESNHDIQMLKDGPYPAFLKKRILSEKGHLPNVETGEVLAKVISARTKHVTLAHLSQENNSPEVALGTVKQILKSKKVDGVMIVPASQHSPADIVRI